MNTFLSVGGVLGLRAKKSVRARRRKSTTVSKQIYASKVWEAGKKSDESEVAGKDRFRKRTANRIDIWKLAAI